MIAAVAAAVRTASPRCRCFLRAGVAGSGEGRSSCAIGPAWRLTASTRRIFSAPGIRDARTGRGRRSLHADDRVQHAPTPRARSPRRSTGCSRKTNAVAVATITSTSCSTDSFASVSRLVAPFGLLNPQFKPAASGVQWARSPAGPFVCLNVIERYRPS
jgi:hypothetical protein